MADQPGATAKAGIAPHKIYLFTGVSYSRPLFWWLQTRQSSSTPSSREAQGEWLRRTLSRIQWRVRAKTVRLSTFLSNLEQMHVIRMFCRGLRLQLVAALGRRCRDSGAGSHRRKQATSHARQRSLVDAHDLNGRTQASLSIAVNRFRRNADLADRSIAITDHGKPLAGFVLDAQGQARQQRLSWLPASTIFPPFTPATRRI